MTSNRNGLGWIWIPAVVASLCIGGMGCSKTERPGQVAEASSGGSKPLIATVNYPMTYFAARIAGELAEVNFPMDGSGDPAYWKPNEAAIRVFQKADLIVFNGADYAQWKTGVTLPENKRMDACQAIQDRLIEAEDGVTHSHGMEGEHSHKGLASITWLDPMIAIEQAMAVKARLVQIIPDRRDVLDANFSALRKDLEGLDGQLRSITESKPGLPLLASHPVYHYLQRRYELNLVSLHWEPDELPSDADFEALEKTLKEHPAKWILWEDDPLPETVQKLKALGVGCATFKPCANRPGEGDYLDVMRRNADNLKRVYGDSE